MKTLPIKLSLLIAVQIFFQSACSQNKENHKETSIPDDDTPVQVEVEVQTLASGLDHPWALAFLPDGRLLVTERAGRLRILDQNNNLSDPISGVPEVFNKGQGGLQDAALDPDFANNSYVYFSYAEPGPNNTAAAALGRGKLENSQITGFKVLFSQKPKVDGGNHFGSRIAFAPDGKIFLAMGERFKFDPAQDLSNHLGTIVRLNPDGTVPQDNPFVNEPGAAKEIWSYGHRNIEAAAFEPGTDKLWIAEMGPKGGDELNQPEAGKNYGWPLVSWGKHYDDRDIPDPPTRPEFTDAEMHWTPVISPSGMLFYNGDMFPELKGNMLIGGLSAKGIVRVQIKDGAAKEIGRIDLKERTRDIAQAPDGSIYVVTDEDNGKILKLIPKKKRS